MCVGTRKTSTGNDIIPEHRSAINYWSLPRFENDAMLQLNREATGKKAQERMRKGLKRLQIPLGGTVNASAGLGIPKKSRE